MGALIRRLGPNASRVVAISSLVLVAVVLVLVVSGSGGTYKMKAQFDDVRGVIPGSPVRAGAVTIGSIESVDLQGEAPVVTMRIDKDFKVHEGAVADIELFSNAGAVNRTIEVTTGDPTKPELKAGSTMSGPATDQPVNFDDAAETLDPTTRANIKRFIIGLDSALKGRGKDFDRTLRHSSDALNETANLLAQVNSDGESLKTLVGAGSRVTATLASSPGDLATVADRTASLLSVTARRQAELARSVQLLGPALSRGRAALASLAAATPHLRTLVSGLGPVADELGEFAKALPPSLRNAVPFLAETRLLVEQAPGNLRDFAPIISSAHRVSEPLGDLIQKVLPLGENLRAYIPETVGFFQNLGSVLGSYDANGHILSLSGGFFQNPPASALNPELGPADCTNGRLKLPYTRLPGTLACQPWADYEKSNIGGGG
jgi:virulence factor Mce-like protein